MAGAFRRESLIPATRLTAAANLAILRTQAASKGLEVTQSQSTVALLMALELERVVGDHAKGRTIL